MDHKEFIESAIKTESVVNELNVDLVFLLRTMELFMEVTELLDAVKKQAFYNNDKKMKTTPERIAAIRRLTEKVMFSYQHLEQVDFAMVRPITNTRVAHGVIGMATESGELVECLYNSLKDNSELDTVNLVEEMFDADWYKAVISDELNVDWGDSWQTIIDKLKARFGDKFTEDKANNRDIEKERKILER